ncbi:hypothetical protein phiST2_0177 [Vibrio phage phi-ST2]|nr:hypothetical protein phiST2_0177 [Vibrio phage phi-ST2]
MYKNRKRVSIYKMKRVAQKPDADVFFQMSQYEHLNNNSVKITNKLTAFVIHGLFLYRTVVDRSQADDPHTMCERLEFVSQDALSRYMSMGNRRRKRFGLDDVLYGNDQCVFDKEIGLTIAYSRLF